MRKRYLRFSILLLLFCVFAAMRSVSQDLPDGGTCLNCHKDKFIPPKRFVHPLIGEVKCKACHNSYDMAAHREGIKPEIDACMRCHTQRELGRSHPVGRPIIDPNTGGEMTCVSTCHSPHGSDYKYELPFKSNMELCLSCHKNF